MAYFSQEQKKEVNENLKKILPKDWKWSLSVSNHTKVVLTIRSAPVDLYVINDQHRTVHEGLLHKTEVSKYRDDMWYEHPKEAEILKKAFDALRTEKYFNDSDLMTDYFHCSHYYEIRLGSFDKPFEVKGK